MKPLHEQTSLNRRRDEEGTRNRRLFNTINNQRNFLSSTAHKMFDTMPKRNIVSWISLISGFDHVFMHHDRSIIIQWAYQYHERIVRTYSIMLIGTIWTHPRHRCGMIGPTGIVRTYQVTPVGIIWTHPVHRLGMFGPVGLVWTHLGCWWVI
ncbi:hypothetical protein AMTRI_Chr13g121510 [Amborella trichopoda]